jgi:single-strand DNA-binding protein
MINRVIIDGFLGKDAEVKKTNDGTSVCNVSIAQTTKDRNGNERTKWFFVTAWKNTADYLGMYCKKGDLILVEGRCDYHEYEKDGVNRRSDEIVAERISIERFGQNHQNHQNATQPTYTQPVAQQTYTQPVAQPTYHQQSMSNAQTTPSEFGLPEYEHGLDIGADDLPF